MADLFDNFLNQALTADNLRDWQHASKLFASNNHELVPRPAHLFHVFFEIDPQLRISGLNSVQKIEVGMMVKNVTLPSITFDVTTLNSYNRKINIQKKLEYEPVTITFHDDSSDLVRKFFASYYTKNYRDGTKPLSQFDNLTTVYGDRMSDQWGFGPKFPETNFLRAIRIFSLSNKRSVEVTLVNPMLKRFSYGTHDTSSNSYLENTMTFAYEAIQTESLKRANSENVKGFGDIHYDRTTSPLRTLGAVRNLFGAGGALETAVGIGAAAGRGDIITAAAGAARASNTYRNQNLGDISASSARDLAIGVLTGTATAGKYFFPSLSKK